MIAFAKLLDHLAEGANWLANGVLVFAYLSALHRGLIPRASLQGRAVWAILAIQALALVLSLLALGLLLLAGRR